MINVLITLVVCYLIIKLYQFCVYVHHMKKLPSLGSKSVLGDLPLFYKHRDNLTITYRSWEEKVKQHGWFVLWLSFYPIMVVYSPQKLRMILGNKKNLDRGWLPRYLYLNLRGLITFKDEEWKKRRIILTAPFSSGIINKSFMATFVESSATMVDKLKDKLNQPINLQEILNHMVIVMALETSFGLKGRISESDAIKWVKCARNFVEYNTNRIYKPYLWLPVISKIVQFFTGKHHLQEMSTLLSELIVSRLEKRKQIRLNENNNDEEELTISKKAFLDHIIDVFMNDPSKFDSSDHLQALLEEVILIFITLYDTTSHAVHTVLFDLAYHPEIQDELYQQLQNFDCENENLTTNDFKQLTYLDWCITESLRLRPSAANTARHIKEDMILDNYLIPKNTSILCNIYFAHRDREAFPSPGEYIPERFSPENLSEKAKEAYMPFGDGPRRCIGGQVALAEIKVVVSNIVKNFKLELVPNQKHRLWVDLTTRFVKSPIFILTQRQK